MDEINLADYMSRQAAAAFLGVHPNTMTNWLSNRTRDDRPKPVQVGILRLYKRSDVEMYARRRESFR